MVRFYREHSTYPVPPSFPLRHPAFPQIDIQALNHKIRDETHVIQSLEKRLDQARQAMEKETDYSAYHLDPVLKPRNRANETMFNETGMIGSFPFSVSEYQGDRPTMEDAFIACQQENMGRDNQTAQIFGILDGHNGSEASKFVKEEFAQEFSQQITALQDQFPPDDEKTLIWNALKQTYVALSEKYPHPQGGTTATIAVIINNKLYVANAGDSRAFLDKNGQIIAMSEDMKPAEPLKFNDAVKPVSDAAHFALFNRWTNRIFKRGGEIIYRWTRNHFHPYVKGKLNLPCSIGDPDFPCMSPRPEMTCIPLNDLPPNTYLYIGCDGVFDVPSSKQVAETGRRYYQIPDAQERLQKITDSVVASTYNSGSGDNISLMVVQLA